MTIARLTLALVVAAAVVLRSAANSWNICRDGDLGHLKDDVAAMARHLRAILISFSFRFISTSP